MSARHNLLSRALQVLTDPQARTELATSLDLLLRVVGVVPPATLASPEDPWLYFYEDFLDAYDPKLRKDAGAYYTPRRKRTSSATGSRRRASRSPLAKRHGRVNAWQPLSEGQFS